MQVRGKMLCVRCVPFEQEVKLREDYGGRILASQRWSLYLECVASHGNRNQA